MLNFHRLKTHLSTGPLLTQIEENPGLWDQITARQDASGSPHKYTKCIFLRWAKEKTVEAAFNQIEAVDYPASDVLTEAGPLVKQVWAETKATELGRVLVVDLAPGGHISQHADEGAYADHYERFHLCLCSQPGNVFLSETGEGSGEYVHMLPGEIWYFNHKAKHMLFNASRFPRRHLIIDMVSPLFRRERH